jgi:uncharacterized membrane protein
MKVGFKRHLAKTITWRIVGSIDTILLSWFITGNFEMGLTIGGVEVITKMILYFIHERIWYKFSKFGVYEEKEISTN